MLATKQGVLLCSRGAQSEKNVENLTVAWSMFAAYLLPVA